MKRVTYFILSLLICSNLLANDFNIATLNIKWFGLGGEMSGNNEDEYRATWIKEFLLKNYSDTQAIVFQEIVNVQALASLMSDLDMSCYSYEHDYSRHQHISICLDNDYELVKIKGDNNYIFEELADAGKGRLRPAVYGIVKNRKTNKRLFSLMGVHLKASQNSSHVRIEQVKLIKSKISKMDPSLPHVIIGDWNTHKVSSKINDIDSFEKILNEVNLKRVVHSNKNTFRSNGVGLLLDHAWISEELKAKNIKVWKACNASSYRKKRFEHISFYNRFISDHCPLSFSLTL